MVQQHSVQQKGGSHQGAIGQAHDAFETGQRKESKKKRAKKEVQPGKKKRLEGSTRRRKGEHHQGWRDPVKSSELNTGRRSKGNQHACEERAPRSPSPKKTPTILDLGVQK